MTLCRLNYTDFVVEFYINILNNRPANLPLVCAAFHGYFKLAEYCLKHYLDRRY